MFFFSILYLKGIDGEDTKVNCKAPGNPKCNPSTWEKYSDGCCSEGQKCTINEGDCNLDTECYGSLICKPNSCPKSTDISKQFHKRASCCQQPSGTYILGQMQNFYCWSNVLTRDNNVHAILKWFDHFEIKIFQTTISRRKI